MKWSTLLSLLGWTSFRVHAVHDRTSPPSLRDYDRHDYYAVHLRPNVHAEDVAAHLGLHYEGPLGELRDHHIFRAPETRYAYDHIDEAIQDLRRRRRKREVGAEAASPLDAVLLSRKQELHKRFPLVRRGIPRAASPQSGQPVEAEVERGRAIAERLGIADPTYAEQWHLFNPVQLGHDINVTGLWEDGITGRGSTTAFVDDGLDFNSDDLHDNYLAIGSYDYNNPGPDPLPRLDDDWHGTRCAGEVGAVRNDVCGVGIAYDSKVSGIRILSGVISNADEAAAMNYAFQDNQIYSCSWGPPDDGKSMEQPDVLIQRAMVNGVQQGRGGLGSIYVFAIGNGAANDDNCNFDGYTNSIYSVSVGGIDRKGLHPYYSEACSAQLVVTYSSGSGDAIHTTDVGKDKCTTGHGGTSAAGPIVAGIYALALQANPALTWRDIQYITLHSAVKLEDQGDDWQMNTAVGKDFSHQFGYGKADAWALVELAKTWTNVNPQTWYFSPWLHVHHSIPQGDKGLTSNFSVTREMLTAANLARLEHVTVTMNVEHTRRGDLSVELISPTGMVSRLSTARRKDDIRAGYVDWTFMSVAHWGESGVGDWIVILKDSKVNEHNGTWIDWRLKIYGEAIDPARTSLLPLPGAHDDDDHDQEPEPVVSSHPVATTSVTLPAETSEPEDNPSDHQDRPVPSRVSTTTTSTPSPTSPARPSEPEGDDHTPTNPNSNPTSSGFLPRPFPTFGVSTKTQIWIYGAIALILAFLCALAVWSFFVRRVKRRRANWRDEYDFELVEHDDDGDDDQEGDDFGGKRRNGEKTGAFGPGGRKKRAGELYDAFAEGSEGSVFGVGSDDEEEEEEGQSEEGFVGGSEEGSGSGSGSGGSASGRGKERYRDA